MKNLSKYFSVTKPDGSQVVEKRHKDGGFRQESIREDNEEGLETIQEGKEAASKTDPEVSKRRAKKVARARQFGFVVDLKPDLQVANIAEGVYIRFVEEFIYEESFLISLFSVAKT